MHEKACVSRANALRACILTGATRLLLPVQGEAALIADKAAQQSRFETGGGPLLRAQSARWLCFGAAGGTGPAALRHANLLCREFALGEHPELFEHERMFGWSSVTSCVCMAVLN